MTGSSDGLIRFWENEGDAIWIEKITSFAFTTSVFVPYLGGKRILAYLYTRQTYHLSVELDIMNCVTAYLLEPTNLVEMWKPFLLGTKII